MHALTAIALVAEEKILRAQQEGAFEHLPGAGRPLPPDEATHMPPEARMAYTILKNSGYLAAQAGPATPAPSAPTGRAEADACSRLRRFALALSRVKRARGEAETLDPMLALGLSRAMQDSPYLEKMLKKF